MKFLDFLKKTWKFLLGIIVAILGMMLFTRRDKTGEAIEKSTDAGIKAIDDIREANLDLNEKVKAAEIENQKKAEEIREIFSREAEFLETSVKEKIEKSLNSEDLEEATKLLAEATGIKNLDQ